MGRRRERETDDRRFVQIAERPSLGVELPSGRGWVGVDRQVGHGSADALFALSDAQYAGALVDAWTALHGFLAACWEGRHPELERFGPGGDRWRPEGWLARRARMLPQRFEGELWRLVDALEESEPGERTDVARALVPSAAFARSARGVRSVAVPLAGDAAHARPAAIVADLAPGSDRAAAARVLGDPIGPDEHAVEACVLRLSYDDDGLVAMRLSTRPASSATPPGGALGVLLGAVGAREGDDAFLAATALAGGAHRRWVPSSSHPRRLLAFAGGVDLHVEDGLVLGASVDLVARAGTVGDADGIVPGVPALATRAALRAALGAPLDAHRDVDLHRLDGRDVLVTHEGAGDDAIATALAVVLVGRSISSTMHRWRSGDVTRFADMLGRAADDPLVAWVRRRDGVRVRLRAGVVRAVEIDAPGPDAAAFVDGMPEAPERGDLRLGWPPYATEQEDALPFGDAWVHVLAPDGRAVRRIVVRDDLPPGLGVERERTAWWGERFGRR